MKKIWTLLLVLGLIICGIYCSSAESDQPLVISETSVLQNLDEGDANSLATLAMDKMVSAAIQMEDEDQVDDEGDEGDDEGGDEDEGEE